MILDILVYATEDIGIAKSSLAQVGCLELFIKSIVITNVVLRSM